MKIELNVFERLNAMQILPKEGTFVTLKLVKDVGEKLGISQDEFEEYDVVEERKDGKKTGKVEWNSEKGIVPKGLEFTAREIVLVADALKELDTDKKLTQIHLSLYEKFVEGGNDADNDKGTNKD